MKCLVCNKEFDEDIEVCPLCGKKLAPNDVELELPMLKEKTSLDMEKTIAILPTDVEEYEDSLSLIDDINKQIENVNEEAIIEQVVFFDKKMKLTNKAIKFIISIIVDGEYFVIFVIIIASPWVPPVTRLLGFNITLKLIAANNKEMIKIKYFLNIIRYTSFLVWT